MDSFSATQDLNLVQSADWAFNQGMGPGDIDMAKTQQDSWENLLVRVGRFKDKDAFAQIFAHFAPRLKSFLMRMGADMPTAEEVVQEAMVMVWRRAETYDPKYAGASTWIFTIARNKRIDRLRRENRPLPDMTDPAIAPEAVETSDKVVERHEDEAKIHRILKKLPEEQAKMIFAAYYDQKSHRDIAEESGVPLGTVKSRIRLALNRMRALLDEEEGIEQQ